MSTRKSSNFRTIMGLEIIPTEKDVINFPNILFVYSRPLTRKRFSVVNIPHKRRADASKIGSNFLNEPIHLESNRFVICICSKSFYGIKDFWKICVDWRRFFVVVVFWFLTAPPMLASPRQPGGRTRTSMS